MMTSLPKSLKMGGFMNWIKEEKEYHDEVSEKYIERQKKSGWRFLERFFLFNSLPSNVNLRILDIGCGPAIGAWENLKNYKYSSVYYVGIDISKELLKYAKNNYPGNYILADVNSIPLSEKAEFDVVVALGILHHIRDWEGILRDITKHLKNGGLMLLREPNENAFITWKGDSPHEHAIVGEEMLRLM
jgi:SAM-dependent methyltransferase